MPMSEAFLDELDAINAIYGEGTTQIISQNILSTRIRLKLPAASYESFTNLKVKASDRNSNKLTGVWKRTTVGSSISFLADFPSSYPQVMPQVASLDASLFEYYEAGIWKVHLALMISLKEVFRPGEVCIHDWFLKCNPGVYCLGQNGFNWAKFAKLAPEFDQEVKAWRWALRQRPMNMEKVLKEDECTICLDEHIVYQMVEMGCGHFFCIDCFHEGWKAAQEVREPFSCCNQRVAPDLIQTFINIDKAQARQYERLLIERDTPQPVYCSQPDCSGFLGSMLKLMEHGNRNVKCPECAMYFCISCHNPPHGGDCYLDPGFVAVMKRFGIRRCPRCGYATMKDGGCSHMLCKSCGMDYTWQKGGGIVPWIPLSN